LGPRSFWSQPSADRGAVPQPSGADGVAVVKGPRRS
jgi:hypothetical protein